MNSRIKRLSLYGIVCLLLAAGIFSCHPRDIQYHFDPYPGHLNFQQTCEKHYKKFGEIKVQKNRKLLSAYMNDTGIVWHDYDPPTDPSIYYCGFENLDVQGVCYPVIFSGLNSKVKVNQTAGSAPWKMYACQTREAIPNGHLNAPTGDLALAMRTTPPPPTPPTVPPPGPIPIPVAPGAKGFLLIFTNDANTPIGVVHGADTWGDGPAPDGTTKFNYRIDWIDAGGVANTIMITVEVDS